MKIYHYKRKKSMDHLINCVKKLEHVHLNK